MIGQTVWRFDINRRVYKDPVTGEESRGPIWRYHWEPDVIVGETRVSWVTKYGWKLPKKGAHPRQWAFSEQEIADRAWVVEHAYKIAAQVGKITNPACLRQVAELIGYTE